VIYGELVKGIVRDESRMSYLGINGRLVAQEAEGMIAGCTEVELLVTPPTLRFRISRRHVCTRSPRSTRSSTTERPTSHWECRP
jgi:hypothetical protein